MSAVLLVATMAAAPVAGGQDSRRLVDTMSVAGRATYELYARVDRTVEILARSADGSTEVTSSSIQPDSAVSWANAVFDEALGLRNDIASNDRSTLQRTLSVGRSATLRNAFVFFVADSAFAQIGVTVTPDELRRFAELLSAASAVADRLPAQEFSLRRTFDRREAVPIPETQQVPYPTALRNAAIQGEVRAQFVVDVAGRVEAHTIKILSATDREFGEAVRGKVRTSRFVPASINGYPVRSLVKQNFLFRIAP